MEIKDLEARIEKKIADIEKTKRSIDKLIKTYNFSEEDIEVAKTSSWSEIKQYAEANWPGGWVSGAGDHQDPEKRSRFTDLRGKYRDLDEKTLTLQKYQNQLALQKAKEDKEANTEKIPAIVEYLDWLKQQWVEKIEEDIVKYETLYWGAYDKWYEEYSNYNYEGTREEHQKLVNALYDRVKMYKKELLPQLDRDVIRFYSSSKKTFDWDKCNESLDKDINALYWDLVNRVTKITGEIIDANLKMSNGRLNGIVVGTDNSAEVETIPAGGYNVQRFHFRTLVKPIRQRGK